MCLESDANVSEKRELTSDAISRVLRRNLSARSVINTAHRVLTEKATAPDSDQSIFFLTPLEPPERLRVEFARAVEDALRSFSLDVELTEWILGLTDLAPAARKEAARLLGSLGELHVRHENVQALEKLPGHKWFAVHGPDPLTDLLLQPMQVLGSYVSSMLSDWLPFVGRGLRTFYVPKMPDPDLVAIEISMLKALDMPIALQSGGSLHIRSGAITNPVGIQMGHPRVNAFSDEAAAEQGFVRLAQSSEDWPLSNVFAIVNELGAGSKTPDTYSGDLFSDPYYGQSYNSSVLSAGVSPYRASVAKPEGSPSTSALSVPFRQVPRLQASSVAELRMVLSQFVDMSHMLIQGRSKLLPLFRGQTHEYLLPRSSEARHMLYGDPNVLEPSLLPSSARRSISMRGAQAFSAVAEIAVDHATNGFESPEGRIWGGASGDLLKSAFAQHYGLPTTSLDLTVSASTAIWFATTRLVNDVDGFAAIPVDAGSTCVIYCFAPQEDLHHPIHAGGLSWSRPNRQQGWVSPMGWGNSSNRIARYLLGAVYFPGSLRGDIEHQLPSANFLFPGGVYDPVLAMTARISREAPESSISAELDRNLYFVK